MCLFHVICIFILTHSLNTFSLLYLLTAFHIQLSPVDLIFSLNEDQQQHHPKCSELMNFDETSCGTKHAQAATPLAAERIQEAD